MTVFILGVLTLEQLTTPRHGWRDMEGVPPLPLCVAGSHWEAPVGERHGDFWTDVFAFTNGTRGRSSYVLGNLTEELAQPVSDTPRVAHDCLKTA